MKMQKSIDNSNSYANLHSKICTALEYHGVDEIRQWKVKIPGTPMQHRGKQIRTRRVRQLSVRAWAKMKMPEKCCHSMKDYHT